MLGSVAAVAPAEIVSALDAFVRSGAIPGLIAILIGPHGDAVVALGRTAPGTVVAPDPRTRFGIASVTKLFTGLALSDLLREGRIALDDPASRYLPRPLPTFSGREISVRHLATHTSALPVGRPGEGFAAARWTSPRVWRIAFRRYVLRAGSGPLAGVTLDDLLAFLAETPLSRAPGEQREYSNVGFGLLGQIVGRVDGRGWTGAMRARLLDPLGLGDTGSWDGAAPAPIHGMNLGVLNWAGGLVSTAADLAGLARAFLHPPPGPLADAMKILLTPAWHGAGGETAWLAFARDPASGRPYHTGMNHAFLGMDRDRGVAAVILLCGSLDENEALGLAVLDRLAGGHAVFPKPRTVVSLPADVLARWAGSYRLDADSSFTVIPAGGSLAVQFMKDGKKGGAAVVCPENDTAFFCREWECRIEFRPGTGGAPDTARVRMYSFDAAYRRESSRH